LKKKEYSKAIIKYLSNLGIFLSALSLSLGILYFFFPINSILYDLFGLVLIISWFLNGALVYFTDIYLNKNIHAGKRINRLSYYYLAIFIISILLMVFGVIFSAFIIGGPILILGNLMIISGFLIANLYGFHFCIVTFTNIDNRGVWTFE
jgi:hypothetical protein